MQNSDDRVSELIAAAVAGELSPADAVELDGLRRTHPWIDEEIASFRGLVARLDASEAAWTDVPDDADHTSEHALRDRITAAIAAEESAPIIRPSTSAPVPLVAAPRRPPRTRRWVGAMLGAAACIGLGIGVGVLLPAAFSAPPTGPPGTLGAVEHVDLRDESVDTVIDADLVAHTWGTEAVVDATGLDVGATYAIVFIGTDGAEFSAGAMLGSPVAIHCRVNAAVLREDVARLEIRDASGDAVATADVPNV